MRVLLWRLIHVSKTSNRKGICRDFHYRKVTSDYQPTHTQLLGLYDPLKDLSESSPNTTRGPTGRSWFREEGRRPSRLTTSEGSLRRGLDGCHLTDRMFRRSSSLRVIGMESMLVETLRYVRFRGVPNRLETQHRRRVR